MHPAFKRFLLLTLITGSLSTYAQEYLVTNKGDTLLGEVRILNFGNIDQAQITINKKRNSQTALEVRSLLIDEEIYKPMKQGNAIRFMKVLKSGYLSLYGFRPENMINYDGRQLVKIDGQNIEVPNLGFKKIMSKFLNDCDEVTSKIQSGELGRSELDTIIDIYNACITSKTNASLSQKTPVLVQPAIVQVDNNKLEAIKNLQSKVENLDQLADKKDVSDLLSDIADKVSKQKSVPNYQLEALKGYLKDNAQTKDELEKVIALLGSN